MKPILTLVTVLLLAPLMALAEEPAAVANEGECGLELRDGDPFDYARAVRVRGSLTATFSPPASAASPCAIDRRSDPPG